MGNWHLEQQQLLHHTTNPRPAVCAAGTAPLNNAPPAAVDVQHTLPNAPKAATSFPDFLSMLLWCTAAGPQVLQGSAARHSPCELQTVKLQQRFLRLNAAAQRSAAKQ